MTKTIRILLPALLLTLCTACTNELTTTPATDNPLVLEHVYIGTPTKAEPIQWDGFREGDQLKATLTLNGVTSEGTYTYKDGTWDTPTPAYWQDPTEAHTLTLRTPEPTDPMPDAFTDDTWHTYDILTYTGTATPGTTSYPLTHTRAQLCVTLTAGETMTGADLTNATIKVNDCGMLHKDNAYYALLAPAATPTLTITYEGDTYTYTPETDILTAGQCTMLTLTLNKTGVSGIDVSNEEWKNVTATSTLDDTWTTIACNGGDLSIPDNATKLLITGTLTDDNVSTINAVKDQITHLYITAESEAWVDLKLGYGEWDDPNETLQSLYLPTATSVGNEAFRSCPNLTSVSLPMAKTIGEKAFINDKGLTHISLPEATTIGEMCFADCYSLSSLNLPQATTIGWCAFGDCKSLTALSLPEANTINDRAFQSCKALTTATLPKATNIGSWALQNCDALTTICLPKDATIGESAFGGSDALTTLYISTPDATEADARAFVEKIPTLTTIHYGYHGTGDYLDPANYTGVYETN